MKHSPPIAALVVLLASVGTATATSLSLPASLSAKPGRLLRVDVQTDTKKPVVWIVPEGDADLIPFPGGQSAIFSAPATGTFRIGVVTSDGEGPVGPVYSTVTVATPGPTPPPPPGPADQFSKDLQAAYAVEQDPQKAALVTNLATVYAAGRQLAQTSGTWGNLYDQMNAQARQLGVAGKLPAVQRVIQAMLVQTVPTDRSIGLDPAGQALAGRTFDALAAALRSLSAP